MQRLLGSALALAFLILALGAPALAQETAASAEAPASANPHVMLETNQGTIVLELFEDKAPKTVANFLGYVEEGFYNGTIFHRVLPRFMIQGGGFTEDLTKKKTGPPVVNEADNGLRNMRGTIAMARLQDPNSATAQFFINTVNSRHLDHRNKSATGWGYTVFGKVVEGMDVVDKIGMLQTTTKRTPGNMPLRDVPVATVMIEKAALRPAGDGDSGGTAGDGAAAANGDDQSR